MFSVVIGSLVAIALVLLGLARHIGPPAEETAATDSRLEAAVAERIAPIGRVAIAGRDNSALAMVAPVSTGTAGAPPAAAVPKNVEDVYKTVCSTCHATGIVGAPKTGDRLAWGPRVAQGKPKLYDHALKGFQGNTGVMPRKVDGPICRMNWCAPPSTTSCASRSGSRCNACLSWWRINALGDVSFVPHELSLEWPRAAVPAPGFFPGTRQYTRLHVEFLAGHELELREPRLQDTLEVLLEIGA